MLNAIILAALVKINLECDSPWVATSLFAGLTFVMSLMFGYPFLASLIGTAINIGLGFFYFWLLKKTESSSSWWAVMIIGIFVFLGLGFL
ncbi:hypothetical protein QEH59_18330 [Coraliomargarita sp. SDUM461004]|uniref:Uncharacterized protein n=1 Tax=Thalassobacterium sedimentorum TaxID=3041258 RepID=A0ABU1ANN0_9BACT|nr:hypothetical protein [Coraliomargarita sp. SDUM461004]MDQ8196392.1 hypothetical protein [Coraliomargarita sp. SDUM461004]